MADTEPIFALDIRKKDFVDAVRSLKPKRVNAATKLSEFQLGYIDGEAVFCINGAQVRRPAHGVWPGFACFRFAFMLAILKVPPPAPQIEIRRYGSGIQIGATRVPARWIQSPEWIAEMALEAHLHGPDEAGAPQELYCPKCSKRKGALFRDLLRETGRYPIPQERIYTGSRVLGAEPTRECRACGHQWIELNE